MKKRRSDNKHLREIPSVPYSEDEILPEFRQFVEAKVLPRIRFTGYKLDQKRETAIRIVHNLIVAGPAQCIADTRNTHHAGVAMRVKVWDAMIDAGLVQACTGSELSGLVTRYRMTRELVGLYDLWERKQRLWNLIDQRLGRNVSVHSPVTV